MNTHFIKSDSKSFPVMMISLYVKFYVSFVTICKNVNFNHKFDNYLLHLAYYYKIPIETKHLSLPTTKYMYKFSTKFIA